MTEQSIPATEARVRFGEVLRRVVENHERFIVERAGQPQVVILAVDDYKALVNATADKPVWRELAMAVRARVQAELQGQTLIDPVDVLAEVRRERDEQYDLH